jgi:hypothetical protein
MARALQINEIAGTFSGLAMGLNALATAILQPLLYRLLFLTAMGRPMLRGFLGCKEALFFVSDLSTGWVSS